MNILEQTTYPEGAGLDKIIYCFLGCLFVDIHVMYVLYIVTHSRCGTSTYAEGAEFIISLECTFIYRQKQKICDHI